MFTPVSPAVTGVPIIPKNMQLIDFTQKDGRWYLAVGNYLWQKGQQAFTEIAAYSDELLDWMSRRRKQFTLQLGTVPFEGARMLELDEFCTDEKGGAYYNVMARNGSRRIRLWVCDTSLLVFGDLPPRIFFRFGSGKP